MKKHAQVSDSQFIRLMKTLWGEMPPISPESTQSLQRSQRSQIAQSPQGQEIDPYNQQISQSEEVYQMPVRSGVRKVPGTAFTFEKAKDLTILSRHHPGVPTPTHSKGHFGIDLQALKGEPVYTIGPGIVSFISNEQTNAAGGNAVGILHENGNVYSYYAHLDKINVSKGQEIQPGQQIGTVGTSGMLYPDKKTGKLKKRITAPHLHFQVKVNGKDINPLIIKDKPIGSLTQSKKAHRIEMLKKISNSKL